MEKEPSGHNASLTAEATAERYRIRKKRFLKNFIKLLIIVGSLIIYSVFIQDNISPDIHSIIVAVIVISIFWYTRK